MNLPHAIKDSASSKNLPFNSIWKNSVHSFGTSLISLPLTVGISILIARHLGPMGKGSYDLVLATGTLMGTLLNLSLPAGVVYVTARGKADTVRLTVHLFWVSIAQAILAFVVIMIISYTRYKVSFLPPNFGSIAIVLITFHVFVTLLYGNWRGILVGCHEIIKANRCQLMSQMLHFILLLGVIAVLDPFNLLLSEIILLTIFMIVQVFGSLLQLMELLRLTLKKDTKSCMAEILKYSLQCHLGNLFQFMNYRLDIFIVSYYKGTESVGLYLLAVSVAQLVWLLSNASATAIYPQVVTSEQKSVSTASITALAVRVVFALTVFAGLLCAVLCRPLLPLVYGEGFRASVEPLLWLLPGVCMFSITKIVASYLAGIGKPNLNQYVAVIALLVTVMLDFILIPRLGINGAAIASSASYSTSAIMTMWLFKRKTAISFRSIVIPRSGDLNQMMTIIRGSRGF